jgi:hypothetical protein
MNDFYQRSGLQSALRSPRSLLAVLSTREPRARQKRPVRQRLMSADTQPCSESLPCSSPTPISPLIER